MKTKKTIDEELGPNEAYQALDYKQMDRERAAELEKENHSLLCKYNAVCGAVDSDPATWDDVGEVCAKIRRLREYVANTDKLAEAIRPFRLP
jgi:hypothetical protein